jgi:hypothetical protein
VLAALFAFLAARRAVPRGGTVAGVAAVLFFLASPAQRAFSTDVMLESLGAGLTMAALYAYLVAVQDDGRSPWPGRWLGLVLTLSFLHKYNYWLLVVLAVGLEALSHGRFGRWRDGLRAVRRFDLLGWLAREARKPSSWLLVGLVGLTLAVYLHGPQPFVLGGRAISLYPPYNFISIAYAVYFVRLALWWRSAGSAVTGLLPAWARALPAWHAWPVAAWLVLPKHLGYFLWFLSPSNAGSVQAEPLHRAQQYFVWLRNNYHAGLASFVVVLVLFAVAVVFSRRMRAGGQTLLWLSILGFLLVVTHPNHKSRYLHSWPPALWAGAGAGLALLLYAWKAAPLVRLRPALVTAALSSLLLSLANALTGPGHADEGGPHPRRPCVLDLTDFYLPELDHSRRATVLSEVCVRSLVEWTYLQRHGQLDGLERHWYGFAGGGLDNRQGFRRWLDTTATDTIVFIERRPGKFLWEVFAEERTHAELGDLLRAQTVFHKVKEQGFPQLDCVVSVWKRAPAASLQVRAP